MSEAGDDFKAMRELSKQKKARNEEWSLSFLKQRGLNVTVLNKGSRHYKVEGFDFWPSTGKFFHQKKQMGGRGVHNLIKIIQSCSKNS